MNINTHDIEITSKIESRLSGQPATAGCWNRKDNKLSILRKGMVMMCGRMIE